MDARRALRAETGSGSVLAVGLLAVVAAFAVVIVVASQLVVGRQRAQSAADAAALAAANTASGLVSGVPCQAAALIAARNGADLSACHLSGLIAEVSVTIGTRAVTLGAQARAGPPGSR